MEPGRLAEAVAESGEPVAVPVHGFDRTGLSGVAYLVVFVSSA